MKKELAAAMVLGTHEVQEMLLINRSRLNALVLEGKLKPMKQLKKEYLFWLPEVEAFKKDLLLDSRSNLYKQQKRGDAEQHAEQA
jgi:hypothetical protein